MHRRYNGCLRIAGHVVYGRYQHCNDQDIQIVKREFLSALGIHNCQFNCQSCLLRYHALIALAKSLKTAKRAVQDSTTKDIIKQMKIALTDKSLPIQRAASEVCPLLQTRQ